VYISKDGKKVIKVNNLSFLNENDTDYEYTRDLDYFIDRIAAHNELFPDTPYNIIGITEQDGKVSIVTEQPYIANATEPAQQEIDDNLTERGFTKKVLGKGVNEGLTGWTDGIYEITDAKPANVLKDADGNLRFIDTDISKAQPTTGLRFQVGGTNGAELTADQLIDLNKKLGSVMTRVLKDEDGKPAGAKKGLEFFGKRLYEAWVDSYTAIGQFIICSIWIFPLKTSLFQNNK